MSFYYYKIPQEKKEAKVYGNKKVEQNELNQITERVTRPTYSSSLIREQKRLYNYINLRENARQRPPTSCRKRPATASVLDNSKHSRRFTDREFTRMIRRLRKPTVSSRVSRVDYDTDTTEPTRMNSASTRPRTAEERTKSLSDLCRPTTASSCKSFDRDKYTGDNYNNHDYEYVYTSCAPPEEIDFLIDRMSKTTIARSRGKVNCPRSPFVSAESEFEFQRKLPLVSGLPKSRTIEEIVGRLYKPSRSGYRSQSTPVSTGI
ncbi:uncharacterized protein LOC126832368 [Patella vulgata]|uniref:uncharacterized protein LOC126832368 n=1 Tax=Patella vulgata TaxID=6465 RepID=UPI0024A9A477|nr:uncharacterized protein LOC126832368 [Patella vulgata]XP_050419078.2 uncharacterized protein LOC126832368 [Patella vulgata]